EDKRFFHHIGLDPMAIARAALHDARHLRVVEGGSTITQQVAKLLLGGSNRGLGQKIREAVIALRLEHRYDKREILALYLNPAPGRRSRSRGADAGAGGVHRSAAAASDRGACRGKAAGSPGAD